MPVSSSFLSAVILPTIWLYIHTKFDAEEYFLGLLLSAYSFAAILAAPVFGRYVMLSISVLVS